MSKLARKARTVYTAKQKEEYAKLMVEDGYTNQQIMEISGAGASAVTRWKRQYLDETSGHVAPGITRCLSSEYSVFVVKKS